MEITLRKAAAQDLPILEEFQKKLAVFENSFDRCILKRKDMKAYNLKKMIKSPKVHFLVTKMEGKIIGCGFGEIKKDEEWVAKKYIGYIEFLYVHERFRRKGIGKEIIRNLIAWFKKKGIKDIRLEVYAENKRAMKAYKKCGFQDLIMEMKYKVEC